MEGEDKTQHKGVAAAEVAAKHFKKIFNKINKGSYKGKLKRKGRNRTRPPSRLEIENIIMMKNGKAVGEQGLSAEILKKCGPVMID